MVFGLQFRKVYQDIVYSFYRVQVVVYICLVIVFLFFLGAVGAGEFVSFCESGDNMGEFFVLEEQRGFLFFNKILFLGYVFFFIMVIISDKLVSRFKLLDGFIGSSEEEDGKVLGSFGGFEVCVFFFFYLFYEFGGFFDIFRGSRVSGNWDFG